MSRLRRQSCRVVLAMLLAAPVCGRAQQPEAIGAPPPAASAAPAAPQPAQAVGDASASRTPDGAPAAATPAAAIEPEPKPASQKEQRKAEKFYLQGAKAIEASDVPAAYEAFRAAAKLDPANQQYTAAHEIARQHLLTQLVQEAEKARLTGHLEVSSAKLREAYDLDPKNPIVAQHVDELAEAQRMAFDLTDENGVDATGPTELSPLKAKKSFHIKANQQEVLRQVLSAYQITPVMDASVGRQAIRLDAEDVDWTQASKMAKLLTGTFFVPLDPKRALVAKDTKENRQKFERLLVESIYLPGLSSTELTDVGNLAKNVFEAPVAVLNPGKNTLTVRAPETRIKALNATLEELLDGRAQVMLEVRLYDVNRTNTTNIGVALPSQSTVFNVDSELNSLLNGNQAAIQEIISSGLAAPGDYAAILAILIATGQITSSVLTQGFFVFGGGISQFGYNLGTVTGNLNFNASDTKALDQIQMRVQDQETATFRVGSRYPIVTSTYSSSGGSSLNIPGLNNAGVSSALSGLGINSSSLGTNFSIPQIQYQDLGLTLKATPRVQHSAEVALNMDLQFTALGGSTLDGNPILNNRKYSATITLKEGATAMVASTLSKQETKAVTGIPGLDELPGLRSATDASKNVNISTLIVLVTPHIVRRSHMNVAGREILLPKHD